MKKYQDILNSDNIARVSKLYNIITLYSGSISKAGDTKMYFGRHRRYIIDILVKNHHSQKTENILKCDKRGQLVRFLENKNTEGSSWDNFLKNYNHDDIFILPPSLYFLLLLKKFDSFKEEEITNEMRDLLISHPCHFDFILQEANASFNFDKNMVKTLQIFQEKAIEDELEYFEQLNSRIV